MTNMFIDMMYGLGLAAGSLVLTVGVFEIISYIWNHYL